ncbi:heat shock factor protein HSF24-like [Primulina eburnea]|uniref:heat shock factor protein HSF24-like n=1 Tax=Primulina eburnea TaxID=1245227 RepID=UPI003C6C1320
MALRSVPAPFLTKTYELVDDPETNDVISWNESGTTFVVWKTAEFAKDLLPNYFKHNNFSSFVRQLNTYGFRKTVPDKWEFANENFKRGERVLLTGIQRRKLTSSQNSAGGKATAADNQTSPAISGEDLGSTSTSSPNSKNPSSLGTQASAQLAADLSDENEKLRKDNHTLSSELTRTKKQCDELIAYLTRRLNVSPEKIQRIMKLGYGATAGFGGGDGGVVGGGQSLDSDDDEKGSSMKLFGVVVKKKRGRDGNIDFSGPKMKEMKRMVPWVRISASPDSSEKVCNRPLI